MFLTPLKQLWLRVPVAELNLVHSGLVLERVRGQVLDPGDVETMSSDELQVNCLRGTDLLADANVPYFSLVDHLLQLLPCRIRVGSERLVQLESPLLERDRPNQLGSIPTPSPLEAED